MRQIPLALALPSEPNFETYAPGASRANVAALHHLRAYTEPGLRPAAPVYLWGATGCGKTHLLKALSRRVQDAGTATGWFDADDPLPWRLEATWGLVVIDRAEALTPAAQQATFALFEDAAAEGVPFAAAGRLPPVDLGLRDDLATRLAWGHVFALEPLAEHETRAALRREADRRGIFLSDEVMSHVLTRFPRDLASLMRLLDRLDEFALARARPVTLPLLRQMLAEGPDAAGRPATPVSVAEAGGR